VREEGERNAEDVHELGTEVARVRLNVVARAAEAAPDDLLAEKLTRERVQTHDVRDRLRLSATIR
jgi:hypothetical protein